MSVKRDELRLPEESNSRIEQLTESDKTAIVLSGDAFRFGANWILLPQKSKNLKQNIDDLLAIKDRLSVNKVSNGYVVNMKESYLMSIVNHVVPGALNQDFVNKAVKRKEDARGALQKLLKRMRENKLKNAKRVENGLELTFAIYSLNEVDKIRLNYKDFEAYKLNFNDTLKELHEASADGLEFLVKVVTDSGERTFVRPKQVVANPRGHEAGYRALDISDTNTGVFITVRCVAIK